MDYSQINAAAEGYKADMTRFLRDLVKIPGERDVYKRQLVTIT